MSTKSVLAVVFVALMLTVSAVELSSVNLASANFMPINVPAHNIEIKADGTVTGTDRIQQNGTVYTFTDDISGSIVVLCDNITIDGQGYILQGTDSYTYGIFMRGRNSTIITDLTVANFSYGIIYSYLGLWNEDCVNNTVTNCTLTGNRVGVGCYISAYITICFNNITNNQIGINNFLASWTVTDGNRIAGNDIGVQIEECSSNSIYWNNFIDNSNQISLDPELTHGESYGSIVNWSQSGIGNFWSDYTGTDANHDGLGDKYYLINAKNQDLYPLMAPVNATLLERLLPAPSPTITPSPTPTASSTPQSTVSQSPDNSPNPAVSPSVPEFTLPTCLASLAAATTVAVIAKRKRSAN